MLYTASPETTIGHGVLHTLQVMQQRYVYIYVLIETTSSIAERCRHNIMNAHHRSSNCDSLWLRFT